MNTKLKFIIEKKNGRKTIKSFLVMASDGKQQNSQISIDGDIPAFFEFSTNFAISNDIILKRKHVKKNGYRKDIIIFNDANYIVDSFNGDLNILNPVINNAKLKRQVVRGLAIGLSAVGIHGFVVSNQSQKDINNNINEDKNISVDNSDNRDKSFSDAINQISDKIKITIDEGIQSNEEVIKDDEMSIMQNEVCTNVFSFNYEDRSSSQQVLNAKENMDVFNEFGRIYGIDPNILMAIMAQESGGVHYNYSENGHAIGGMQIENVWNNEKLTAFNFDTNSEEEICVDYNMLGDFNYNVKVASMILQSYLRRLNYDIPKSIQAYNMGIGKINSYGNDWINSRYLSDAGDCQYIEHVFSNLPDGYTVNMKSPDGLTYSVRLDNLLSNNYNSSMSIN